MNGLSGFTLFLLKEREQSIMDYEFILKNSIYERIVFTLILDKKKMTERIIIGESEKIKLHLEHGNGNVYYDKTRPLGSMLIYFERDTKKEWNINAGVIKKSYEVIFTNNRARKKGLHENIDFLQNKIDTGEPTAMYAAIHTWEQYLNCYRLNHSGDLFIGRSISLYRPFYRERELWESDNGINAVRDDDTQVELWYPSVKRPLECVVGFSSFMPLISYYLHKVDDWGYVIQQCKVCNKMFLARSLHYELCSDECRKKKYKEAKTEYEERTKDDTSEKCHKAAYYYWYNRQRKLREDKTTTPDKQAAYDNAFSKYRKEARKRKAEVKRDKSKLPGFTAWIEQQKNIADNFM